MDKIGKKIITASMTADDLCKIYKQDQPFIESILQKKYQKLIKELRKGLGKFASQCYDVQTSNAFYKCSLCVQRSLGDCRIHIFIYIQETNEYVCVDDLASESNAKLFAYTPHYVQRYAQRFMQNPNLTINQSFAAIERNFGICFKIYEDDKNEVMAMSEGLALAKINQARDIVIYKTFISTDLLKTSQVEAYEKVASLLEDFTPKFKSLGHYGSLYDSLMREVVNKINELNISLEDTQKIYGKFFQDQNEKN